MLKINQYNPITERETDANASASCRIIHDIANGINAFKFYVPRVLVNYMPPGGETIYDSSGDEDSLSYIYLGEYYIPPGYNRLNVKVLHKDDDEAANLTIYLYAANMLLSNGLPPIGSFYVTEGICVREYFVSSDTSYADTFKILDFDSIIDRSRLLHLYVTYKSSTASTLASSTIRGITITAGGVFE